MARKAETTFIGSIHKLLPLDVHREKMNNPYRSGTADVWYSGQRDLWIEYKFLPSLPKRLDTPVTLDLSENQKIWLSKRHREGRHVAVICGCKSGGVIFEGLSWQTPLSAEAFAYRIISRAAIASWLLSQTGVVQHDANQHHLQSGGTG